MKKTMILLSGALMAMVFAACGNKAENKDGEEAAAGAPDATEVKEEKVDTVKGPATVTVESFSVDVPEGWYVKSQGSNSCSLEPLNSPNIDGKSNFGWRVDFFAMSGEIFNPEEVIKEDKEVFENTKSMPDKTIAGIKYMYNFYDYEFGKHSVMSTGLPGGGYLKVTVGGYAVEDAEVDNILKTVKLIEPKK